VADIVLLWPIWSVADMVAPRWRQGRTDRYFSSGEDEAK